MVRSFVTLSLLVRLEFCITLTALDVQLSMPQLVLHKMTLFFEFVTAIRAHMIFALMLFHVPLQVTVVRKL